MLHVSAFEMEETREMRKNIGIGIGAATAAIALTTGAGAALASSGGDQQAAGSAVAASVNRHITKAQAAGIAKAKVPHSRVIEIESDDLHNRSVWKVKLASPHGRVIVAVDKQTGKATIVRSDSSGHDNAAGARALSSDRSGSDSARDAREDVRDEHGREVRMEDRRDDGRHGDDDHGGEHRGGDDRGGSSHR
jgi:hypothetical protein